MISKRDLIARGKQREEQNNSAASEEQKINPELQKMHEIFGNPNANCGAAAQYEDGTCSRIVYDPAKMSFRKRTGLDFSSTAPLKDYPTQAERQAETVYRFTHILGNRKSRNEY